MIPTLACFNNAGAFDSSEFNRCSVCGLNAFMGSHGHIRTLLKQRFVWIYNLSNEFCELIFMVLENGRHFNYFKFSCPCLDPRLCVVKYMKVNCFSDG